jgi:hypothetical protein
MGCCGIERPEDVAMVYPITRLVARKGQPNTDVRCQFVITVDVPVLSGQTLTDEDQQAVLDEIQSNLEIVGLYPERGETLKAWLDRRKVQ